MPSTIPCEKLLSWGRTLGSAWVLLGCVLNFAWPHPVMAFSIYNQTSLPAAARVLEGDFVEEIPPGESRACHWSNEDCNPSGERGAMLTAVVETEHFKCALRMPAGGWVEIKQEGRHHLGLPPNLYCQSFHFDPSGQLVDSEPYGVGAAQRNVRFLATADPQYFSDTPDRNAVAAATLETMFGMLNGDRTLRGILIAGDLTQFSRKVEFESYWDSLLGLHRYVFDGLGNHDLMEPEPHQRLLCDFGAPGCIYPDVIRGRMRAGGYRQYGVQTPAIHVDPRKRVANLTSAGDPHYSWDWHDIHFVQLNVVPGNSPEAMGSLAFLQADLAIYVGNSGRPVILVHHYGFDCFSTGACNSEAWWTQGEREAYWEALAPYNVLGIFTGHNHYGPRVGATEGTDEDWMVRWDRPAGLSSGPDSIPTFVAGAALSGAFLEVTIDEEKMVVLRRDGSGDEVDQAAPPEAVAGAAYTIAEGGGGLLDGSGSSDANQSASTLTYEWDFDGDGEFDDATGDTPTFSAAQLDGPDSVDVALRVTDLAGFRDYDAAVIRIANQPPSALLTHGGPVAEGGTGAVRFTDPSDPSGADTAAGFTYHFDFDNDGSFEASGPSPVATVPSQYFPEGPATRVVRARIADKDGGFSEYTTALPVTNVPPVPVGIAATSVDENESTTLSGTIRDPGVQDSFTLRVDWGDGSPTESFSYPAGSTAFQETHRYLDDDPTATPQDDIAVVLTLRDDDGGTDGGTTSVTVRNVAPAILSLGTNSEICGQAGVGGVVELSGTFEDAGLLDTHSATIDWGDGVVEAARVDGAGGGGSFSGSHAYQEGGIHTVMVTLTDDDSGEETSETAAAVVGVGLRDGTLWIVGNDDPNFVRVDNRENLFLRVDTDFPPPVGEVKIFDPESVDLILGLLCGEDDEMTIDETVHVPALLDGGDGDDSLRAGGAASILLGAEGQDELRGGPWRDLLIGGTGKDRLDSAAGQDLLISGTTAFDIDDSTHGEEFDLSLLWLLSIQTEWTSAASYGDRVWTLRNDPYFLIQGGSIFDDEDLDILDGARGRDWFFYQPDQDHVIELKAGEVSN